MKKILGIAVIGISLFVQSIAYADITDQIKQLGEAKINDWLNNPILIDAIKSQNDKHTNLSDSDIQKLDKQWRAETKLADQPLIQQKLTAPASEYLRKIQEESQGLYTEIFVMDNKGLNVAQSDVTSDYWQGDEAKWQKTFLVGKGSMHVSDVELDESTQIFQAQLSVPILDPETNIVIGAATIGVNVDGLE